MFVDSLRALGQRVAHIEDVAWGYNELLPLGHYSELLQQGIRS